MFTTTTSRCETASRDTYHHGDLPAALVGAARSLLAESGADLSLREVARRAGVSNAAPYRHFDGLPALLDAVAAAVLADLAAALEAAAASSPTATAALEALAVEYLRFVVGRPAEARIAFARPKEARIPGTPAAAAAERAFGAVVHVMARGQAAGEFREGDPVAAAVAGWSLIHGTATLVAAGQLTEQGAEREALVRRTLQMLLAGLRSSPPAGA